MRGRWHGGAVTDEVGQFCLRDAVHLISRLRRQLPLIGEAIGISLFFPPPIQRRQPVQAEVVEEEEGEAEGGGGPEEGGGGG